MSAGVLLPAGGLLVEPYILVWLGALLFLNLIRLKTSDLLSTFTKPRRLALLSAVKLVALPLGMYVIAHFVYQPFALPVLLLSGISTGLGAPFVVNLIGGRLPLVVGMIIATSLAVPFVLPSLVYALVGSQFDIPVLDMVLLLAAVDRGMSALLGDLSGRGLLEWVPFAESSPGTTSASIASSCGVSTSRWSSAKL